MVYKVFLRDFGLNRLPRWVDPPRQVGGAKEEEEKCYEPDKNSPNETTLLAHHDCYDKINDTEHLFRSLHLWLDGCLVPFTGKIFISIFISC
jgi:hypothetical protein